MAQHACVRVCVAVRRAVESTLHKRVKVNGREFETAIVDTAGQDEMTVFNQVCMPTGRRYDGRAYALLDRRGGGQRHSFFDGYVLVFAVTSKASLDMVTIINDKVGRWCLAVLFVHAVCGSDS